MILLDDGTLTYSASDLTSAAQCEHAVLRALDARLGRGPAAEPEADVMLARVAHLGDDHEQRVLRGLVERYGVWRPGGPLREVPAAFVVGRDGVPLSAELLRAHLDATGMAKQKIPAAWRFVDELPRTGIHKIAKAELIARLQAEVRDTGSLPVEELR